MPVKVPGSAAELTAKWFSELLSDDDQDIEIAATELKSVGAGSGMMSVVYRASLSYLRGSGPETLIVKLPTEILQNREIAVQFDNFRREVEFYRQAADATPMRTAHVYLAENDGPDNFILVLEDLGDWDVGDQIAGCSVARAEAVMDELAALHGSFWNKVDDGTLNWLPDNYPSVMSDGLFGGTEASWDNFSKVFDDLLNDELSQAKTRYLDGLPKVQSWMNASPRTIVHGDYRMDNLFFLESDGGIEVACCDFQAPVRGKGIQDVAYFLSGSIDIGMRRDHEKDLINRWLEKLGEQGISDYSFEQAWTDYRMGVLMVRTYVVIVGGGMSAENERGDNWVEAMVERSIAAMTDLDCLALLG